MSHEANTQRLIAVRRFVRFCLNVSFILLTGIGMRLYAQVAPIGSPASASATNTITGFTAVAGTLRVLVVTASDAGATNITGVTFNGTAMTEQAEHTDDFRVDAIYMLALGTSAGSTTGNIVITSNNVSHSAKVVFARVFENVDETNPLTSILAVEKTINPASDTLTVTSAPGDLVYDIFESAKETLPGSTHFAGNGQTIMHTVSELPVAGGIEWFSTSTKPGAASVAMSRRTTNHQILIHIAANIKAAAVVPPSITVFPYFHTFPVGTNWTTNQSVSLWQLAIATGPRGSTDTVAKADFFTIGAGNEGYLMSPPMNLPVIPNPGTGGALVMTFHVAYRAYTGGENDSLAVVLSTDGGLTFPNELWVKSRNSTPSLATLPQSSTGFFPIAASDWRYETVVLSAFSGQSNVVIAFRANSRFGNNCFIDNVRINLAQNLTTYTVNVSGSYAGDGGVYVFFSGFSLAQPGPLQSGGQHVSMNLDGSPIAVSTPGEKVSRLSVPDVVPGSSPTSLSISGGTLYIARYTGRPPTASPAEFAQNTTAPTSDFSIFTPNNTSDNRWWTVTYSGDDSIRANWEEEIDYAQLPGVSQAQKLYIMERTERDTSWIARGTTISGGRLTRSSLRRGFVDVAVGSRTEYNPGIWNQLKGSVRVILQGPYNTGPGQLKIAGASPMNTALKSSGILAARFGAAVPATAVDSIAVEIRNAPTAAASTIRLIQPAWLLRYGAIVNFTDTTKNYIEFGGAPNGNYYLVVWHRNHLGVMSATPRPLTTAVPAEYNFTTAQSQAYGANPMVQVEPGVYAMYGGDVNTSNTITKSDAAPILNALNASGYLPGDINLSGIVTAADANLILTNVNVSGPVNKPAGAGIQPTSIKEEEVPREAAAAVREK